MNSIELCARPFPRDQTYRIDHFLGKETAQNILVLRFANAIFEPIWNGRYVDHIQITAAETLGVEGRAGYYEGAGALRDMVQNHLLQLLCLVAMEPPTDLGPDSIRGEKVKIVKSLRRMSHDEIARNVVRGQYAAGAINGKEVPAYRNEKNVKPESKTETFVALKVRVDDWRLADVPIYIRVGKRLPKSGTEISVHFKKAPAVLFNKESVSLDQNVLVIRIQPDEGISLRMQAKMPGHQFSDRPGEDGFSLRDIVRQGEPRSLRAAVARCDERRRHAFRAPRRGRGSVGLHRSDRRGLGGERESAGLVRIPRRLVGSGGSGRAAGARWPRLAAALMKTMSVAYTWPVIPSRQTARDLTIGLRLACADAMPAIGGLHWRKLAGAANVRSLPVLGGSG